MIEIDGLTHDYGTTRALDGVRFSVRAGEVVGLVGPNGAGKTTLMRTIATLLRPTAGRVRVDGRDSIADGPGVRAAVGYLPERASLYGDLLVWEYVDLFAEIAGHDRAERVRRVGAALQAAGLSDRRSALTRELSKGLRQRLALHATLVHDPKAIVLDEPTDGLDPESREQVLRDVRRLAEGGRAVLLSSHILPEVEQAADRTIILVAGRIADRAAEKGRRFSIRVRGDLETARRAIAGDSTVRGAAVETGGEPPAGRLVIDLGDGVPDAADVVRALCAAGVAVVEVVEEREGLKEQFQRAVHPPKARS